MYKRIYLKKSDVPERFIKELGIQRRVSLKKICCILRWGTYGKRTPLRKNLIWGNVWNLSDSHIKAILDTEAYWLQPHYTVVLNELLNFRKENSVVKETGFGDIK